MSDEEEERTIFDACMTFTEVCEADEAGDATTLADFTKSLEEVRTFLAGKGAETADDIDMFAGEDGIELTMAAVGRHSADQVTLSLCWQVLSLVCVNAEMRRSIKNAGAFDYLLAALRDFDAVPAMQVTGALAAPRAAHPHAPTSRVQPKERTRGAAGGAAPDGREAVQQGRELEGAAARAGWDRPPALAVRLDGGGTGRARGRAERAAGHAAGR